MQKYASDVCFLNFSPPRRTAVLKLFVLEYFLSFAKEQRNAPDTCQSDNRINHAAYSGSLTAKSPCYYVELKQSDAAPVDGTNYYKD